MCPITWNKYGNELIVGAQHFLHVCMCAQQIFRSACVSAQSDQNLHCPPEDSLDPWLPTEYHYEHITKIYLYNYDPLKPHFYIVKVGFTGVYIIFPISAQNIDLWVFVRTASPRRF